MAAAQKVKPKRCRNQSCRKPFPPRNSMQAACSPSCAIELARYNLARRERRETMDRKRADRVKLEALKTKPQLTREAQKAFNAFIRLRDEGKPCICCGKTTNDKGLVRGSRWDAGHYRSTGSAPHLRFVEDNCHRQMVDCNRYGAGRAVDYRIGLIERIGLERVEALEADNTPRNYTHDDLRQIRDEYRERVNRVKRERTKA